MSTTSTNLGLILAEPSDVVDVDQHVASNFATLDSKWSSPGAPAAVEVGGTGTPGSSTVVSRSDHVHGVATGTPVATSTANGAGTAITVAASDHVHKTGDNSVATATIQDSAVTTAKINNAAVNNDKLATDSVAAANLKTDSVTTIKIVDLNVTTAKVADSGITTPKVADSAITTPKVADSAITAPKIAAGNVTISKFDAIDSPADDEVLTATGSGNMEWQTVAALTTATPLQAASLASSSVTTAKVADEAITEAKLDALDTPNDNECLTYDSATGRMEWQAASSLVSTSIADGSITRAKLEATLRPPYGMIQMFGGASATAPNAAGWLKCDGSEYSQTTHANLYAAIGTAFNTGGEGGGNFRVPDFRGRAPFGVDSPPTLALGYRGGSFSVDFTHTHGGSISASASASSTNTVDAPDGGSTNLVNPIDHTHSGSMTTTSQSVTSSSYAPPYLAVNFYIYSGVAIS